MVGVLEMNKSIFGSTFIEKKASRRARKAMAMDLMVPSNAVEVTSEEMEYIDGGGMTSVHYSGWDAVGKLGAMMISAFGWYCATNALMAAIVAGTATGASGVSLLLAIAATICLPITIALTCVEACNVISGLSFFALTGGFTCQEISLFWGAFNLSIVSGI